MNGRRAGDGCDGEGELSRMRFEAKTSERARPSAAARHVVRLALCKPPLRRRRVCCGARRGNGQDKDMRSG